MFVIGITGPSGAGKGEISNLLSAYGAYVIDADAVYHDVVSPPSSCLDELIVYFGKDIINSTGGLDRTALAKLVFGEGNRERLELLNKITHKYVVKEIRDRIIKLQENNTRLCVIDAPLLIEAGLCSDCDLTIAILAKKEIRADRISLRDSISYSAAMARINSQKDDKYYITHTDSVIYNDAGVDELKASLDALLRERNLGVV